jgi:LmbE family N-acetylglucosaminyl deacetylase
MAPAPTDRLPPVSSALAVIAHPDDESFGLGAVLSALVDAGVRVTAICFTHGEASTLGADIGDLHHERAAELADAARALGLGRVELLGHPDGELADVSLARLSDEVVQAARSDQSELVVTFDEGGITGHPDHQRATEAARAAANQLGLPVLAWAVPGAVAAALNAEFATAFVGRSAGDIDIALPVERARQLQAIACHRSQSTTNPVLWRRLELTGSTEMLRWLRNQN